MTSRLMYNSTMHLPRSSRSPKHRILLSRPPLLCSWACRRSRARDVTDRRALLQHNTRRSRPSLSGPLSRFDQRTRSRRSSPRHSVIQRSVVERRAMVSRDHNAGDDARGAAS
ncbi:hypothetical protein OBBRIDRAFT_668891 [Obba rivulosa]|uniref:Uncharacterized protein n=1 Tax=Obba rivulosa TaxID=1052685 RepID=A0A8E2AZD5_9APHY|nr:hypothetical protein OBBRIDRAFT_668891 [Obba rivulosa]